MRNMVNFYIVHWSISIRCNLLYDIRFCFMISLLTAYTIVYIPYWSTVKYRSAEWCQRHFNVTTKIRERRYQVTRDMCAVDITLNVRLSKLNVIDLSKVKKHYEYRALKSKA